jgi:acyl-coenzyme A synthetase/AMP-(fatty) acid ligase
MKIFSSNPVAYGDAGEAYLFVELNRQVHVLSEHLKNNDQTLVLVSCLSTYHFLVVILGVMLAGKRVVILPNGLPGTMKQYKDAYDLVVNEDFLKKIPFYFQGNNENFSVTLDIPEDSEITFFTSGSMGTPSKIIKKLSSLWAEITDTTSLSGIAVCDIVVSTVPHHHMYGFLFKVLGPLFAQKPFYIPTIRFPDDMKGLENFMLVSSPAFLTRLDESDSISGCNRIISSGGPLSLVAGKNAEKIFDASGVEVYGSTETGGIAYRTFSGKKLFSPLPGVIARANNFGQLEIKSNYMDAAEWYLCNDFVTFDASSTECPRFEVIGRSDDVIKIEEKRISLADVQNLLLSHFPYIERVYIVPFDTAKRKKLASLIVIKQAFHSMDMEHYVNDMTAFLMKTIDPIFVPKKWKILKNFEANEMGKVSRSQIMEILFGENLAVREKIGKEVA